MNKKPAALHYADLLKNFYLGLGRLDATGAAAELRRLHEEVKLQKALVIEAQEMAIKLAGANQELPEALNALLARDEGNTCTHEHTHRGGAIWEICDDCGAQWADDRGGKPEWQDPKEWVTARAAIAKHGGS